MALFYAWGSWATHIKRGADGWKADLLLAYINKKRRMWTATEPVCSACSRTRKLRGYESLTTKNEKGRFCGLNYEYPPGRGLELAIKTRRRLQEQFCARLDGRGPSQQDFTRRQWNCPVNMRTIHGASYRRDPSKGLSQRLATRKQELSCRRRSYSRQEAESQQKVVCVVNVRHACRFPTHVTT